MEWLKQLIEAALKGKVSDEGKLGDLVSGVLESVKKEIGKHFVPKDDFNSKNDELKETKKQMDELQKQVKDLGANTGATEEIKKKLKETEDAFNNFRTETEKRETNRKKLSAVEKGLRDAKASGDALDLLTSQFDLDKITLDNKGNIVDWEDHLKPIKESRKTLFGEVKTDTGKPNNGGGSGGGGNTVTKQQLIDKYNEVEKNKAIDPVSRVSQLQSISKQIKEFKE